MRRTLVEFVDRIAQVAGANLTGASGGELLLKRAERLTQLGLIGLLGVCADQALDRLWMRLHRTLPRSTLLSYASESG